MNLGVIVLDESTSEEAVEQFAARLKPSLRQALELVCKETSGKLAQSLDIVPEGPRVLRVVSSLEYGKSVDRGGSPRVMWNLINRVVPLKLNGTTIFRKVTLNSLLRGRWRYPGTAGKGFVEKGAALAKAGMDLPVQFRVVKSAVSVVDIG